MLRNIKEEIKEEQKRIIAYGHPNGRAEASPPIKPVDLGAACLVGVLWARTVSSAGDHGGLPAWVPTLPAPPARGEPDKGQVCESEFWSLLPLRRARGAGLGWAARASPQTLPLWETSMDPLMDDLHFI